MSGASGDELRVVVFSIDNLRACIFDLYVAGQETTSSTMCFLIIYLLNHPDALARVYGELDEKVGSNRLIDSQDRAELVWLNAAINVCL